MRIAVLGVGLIGGSIGLAARQRLEAEVAGFDPDRANLDRALELGALSELAGSAGDAVAGAELVFCAAPVRALPEVVAEALVASGEDTVVTDVGSTKRQLVSGLRDHPAGGRFIGGHPLAGAETAGVEHARADLFEGAHWYLTPGASVGGVHYDRLQRALAALGARPQAVDAESHDRLMATVSHLPHVIANVLVAQAQAALSEEAERLPQVGPSFRDTTRVAGSNPAIWTDIFTANADAVAGEIDRVVERLREAADLLRAGDAGAVDAWQRDAGAARRRLADAGVAGGTLRELRVGVDNRPGVVAEIALALGKAGVNIEDMALYPAADMRTGAISLWVAGDEDAARAAEVVRGLGHTAAPLAVEQNERGARFEPSGPLSGALRPPPDKSISHRAALLAAMAEGNSAVTGFLDSADTRATLRAVEALGSIVEVEEAATAGALDLRIEGIGLRGPGERAGPNPLPIDVGNAGTLLRLLPGWLAAQGAGAWRLDGDESIRRRPVDRVVLPLREMGADVECRDDRLPPLDVGGAALHGISFRMPIASAQVKSCILLAGLGAEGETDVLEPGPSRDHTERMLVAAGARISSETSGHGLAVRGELPARRIVVEPAARLAPCGFAVPGDFSSAAFLLVAALIVPGSRVRLEGVGLNPTRVGLLGILNRMGAAVEVEEGIPLGGEPQGEIDARHSALRGTRVAAGEVPLAIDELPLVGLAACFAEGETVVSGAQELRHKESDRIAAVVAALRALGGEAEALDDGFAVRGTGGLRGGAIDSHGDHRLAMLGAVAGLASRDGVEVTGMDAAGVSYPGFERDLRSLS